MINKLSVKEITYFRDSDYFNDLIIYCKKMEIESLEKAEENKGDSSYYQYWSGKAQAFSQVWENLVFMGETVASGEIDPDNYNEANDFWSKKVNELKLKGDKN
jgi:hypothetical protein